MLYKSLLIVFFKILITSFVFAQDHGRSTLLIEYLFDNDTGVSVLNSASNLLHGERKNNPSYAHGYISTAMEFDDTDDYVLIGDTEPELDLQHYTAMSWVYPYSRGSDAARMEIMEKVHMMWQNIRRETGLLRIGGRYIKENNQEQRYYVDSDSVIPLNTWTHITSVNNGQTLKSFINGREAASVNVPDSVMVSDNVFTIGSKQTESSGAAYFHGLIDEVRIFNSALSVDDIKYWMNKDVSYLTNKYEARNKIRCFPNPVKDNLSVKFDLNSAQNVTITMVKTTGEEVAVLHDGYVNKQQINLTLPYLHSGLYILLFKADKFYYSEKIVITD